MTNRRRVSPGQPIRPNMTAGHFNDSIPTTMGGTSSQEERSIHREEIIYCVVDAGSPTPSTQRYHTVAVIDSMEMDDLDRLVPKITIEPSDITECNWGVAHEGVDANSTCLTCIGGITRADVDIIDPAHLYVTWNPVTETLETTGTWGKAYLIKADPVNGYAVIYISKCPSLEAIPQMRFFTNTKIVNRVVTGEVDIVSGRVINPATQLPYVQGDDVTLHDPGNLFPEIEPDGTGWAYYRRSDTPTTPSSHEERWEIEHCSLPITEILAKLTDCLHYQDSSTTAFFGSANAKPNFIASTFPNRDLPPEVSIDGANDYSLSVKNPCKLDGVKDVDVIIRRRTDSPLSDPRNLVAPSPKSTTFQEWEIVKVFEQFARWAKFQKSGANFILVGVWEGADPTPCGTPTLTCAFDCSCLEDGDEIIGFYDPISDEYIGISTESALMGPPDDVTHLIDGLGFNAGNCYITYTTQILKGWPCGNTPTNEVLALPITVINSFEGLYANGSQICASYQAYYVISCGAAGSAHSCVDICPLLCLCEEIYSHPDICEPPPPPNCNCCDCFFTEGATALQITLDGDTHGTTDINSGFLEDNCLWRATFTDAITGDPVFWIIEHVCDQAGNFWTAAGSWPGATDNGITLFLTGPGDCTGSGSLTDPSPGATGSVDADGIQDPECIPPTDCCDRWSGDETVIEFTGSNFDDWEIVLIDGVYPIVGVGCSATATILCRVTNSLFGGEFCDVTVELTLQYDTNINGDPEEEGCRWHYVIPACDLQGGEPFPGDSGALFGCLTGGCAGALSTCGETGFLTLTLQIDDPDSSVINCVAPGG